MTTTWYDTYEYVKGNLYNPLSGMGSEMGLGVNLEYLTQRLPYFQDNDVMRDAAETLKVIMPMFVKKRLGIAVGISDECDRIKLDNAPSVNDMHLDFTNLFKSNQDKLGLSSISIDAMAPNNLNLHFDSRQKMFSSMNNVRLRRMDMGHMKIGWKYFYKPLSVTYSTYGTLNNEFTQTIHFRKLLGRPEGNLKISTRLFNNDIFTRIIAGYCNPYLNITASVNGLNVPIFASSIVFKCQDFILGTKVAYDFASNQWVSKFASLRYQLGAGLAINTITNGKSLKICCYNKSIFLQQTNSHNTRSNENQSYGDFLYSLTQGLFGGGGSNLNVNPNQYLDNRNAITFYNLFSLYTKPCESKSVLSYGFVIHHKNDVIDGTHNLSSPLPATIGIGDDEEEGLGNEVKTRQVIAEYDGSYMNSLKCIVNTDGIMEFSVGKYFANSGLKWTLFSEFNLVDTHSDNIRVGLQIKLTK